MKKIKIILLLLMFMVLVSCDNNSLIGLQGPQGEQGIQGEIGPEGPPGADGKSPVISISLNGNWVIDGVDTGVRAKAEDGSDGLSAYEIAVEHGFKGNKTEWLKSLEGAKGEDGREIELNVSLTHIEWRYSGEESYSNLISLDDLKGEDGLSAYEVAVELGFEGDESEWLESLKGAKGEDGREVEFHVSLTHIEWRYVGEEEYRELIALSELVTQGGTGSNGLSAYEIAVSLGFEGDEKAWLKSLKGEKGDDGREVEFHVSLTHIEWRYVGEEEYKELIALDSLKASDGTNGLSAYEIAVSLGFEGDEKAWLESLKGEKGVGIERVALVYSIGYVDTYAIVFTDGTTSTFNVTNGINGEDGLGISKVEILNGELIITYTDGNVVNLGDITSGSTDGGKGIKDMQFNSNGELIVTLIDDTVINCGQTPTCLHNYSSWSTQIAPTCSSIGVYIRTCSKCDNKDYQFVEKLEHEFGETTTLVSTCSQYIRFSTCNLCAFSKVESLTPVINHKYILEDTVEPSCEISGSNIYRCEVCSTYYEEKTERLEHNFIDGVCSNCGFYIESEGLEYSLLSNDTYEVIGIGTCSSKYIIIPRMHEGKLVTSICANLSGSYDAIFIPDTITKIYTHIFDSNTVLERIIVDENNPVYDSRYNCNAIIETSTNTLVAGCNETKIPNTVTSIAEYAFYNSHFMDSITIPSSVKNIGYCAFANCYGIKTVTVYEGINRIYTGAFSNCYGIENVYFIGSEEAWDNIKIDSDNMYLTDNTICFENLEDSSQVTNCLTFELNGSSYKLVAGSDQSNIVIPNEYNGLPVTSIDSYAFVGSKYLTSITIPSNITSIGSYAFDGCSSLENIIFEGESKLTTINSNAFRNCTSLESLTIPSSVTTVYGSSFVGCKNLKSITVDENNTKYDSRNNCNAIIDTTTNALVLGCQNTIIPNTVTSIATYAFSNCINLNSITIPSSVTSIGVRSFVGCTSLRSIILPKEVTSIGVAAFDGCSSLKKIYYTGTEDDWSNIEIKSINDCLTKAEIVYNYSEN